MTCTWGGGRILRCFQEWLITIEVETEPPTQTTNPDRGNVDTDTDTDFSWNPDTDAGKGRTSSVGEATVKAEEYDEISWHQRMTTTTVHLPEQGG